MRSRTWKLVRFFAPVGLIPFFACLAPPVESPRTTVTQETKVRVAQTVKNQVDLLFVIDNSLSMLPKQAEVVKRIPRLVTALQSFADMGSPASYHIGVITSDLGADPGGAACKIGGDGAVLQIAPAAGCTSDPTCQMLIPAGCSNFALSGGVRFLDYNQLDGTNNIMGGLDVGTAFTCMAMTGQKGCGLEHQLEAAYRALHDNIKGNENFLRSDAILAVVFVTDEDDCSADSKTDLFNNSATQYGPLTSFRCTQYGVECNGALVPPMATTTPFMGCMSAPNPMDQGPGKLIDISKYINFFTKPAAQGGVKNNPDDVILVSISATDASVGVHMAQPGMEGCPSGSASPCPTLDHSCVAASNPQFFGDPAVRLNTVVRSAAHNNITSICDTDYTSAIDALGQLIISQIGVGCLNSPVANRKDAAGNDVPDCSVEDVFTKGDGTVQYTEIPSCYENGHKTPCWTLDDKLGDYNSGACYQSPVPPTCKLPSTCQPVVKASHLADNPTPTCAGTGSAADPNTCELATVTIDRGGVMPPSGTVARVSCATIASSTK